MDTPINTSKPQDPARTDGFGQRRFFNDQTYHFQTLRVFSDIPFGGADTSEVLETIATIREGDVESWYTAWTATAQRNAERAETARDPVSKGLAWHRAHTYWRTAEFLLKPADPRRKTAWTAQVEAFDKGLESLGIAHERFEVPYEGGRLRAIFYPGPKGWETKPLIVFVGGFDSTLEELYFALVSAAHQRGYAVLTYEGPGQGAALREWGLPFIPDWEKPNGAVLDAYLDTHPKPPKTVLVGMSMGGYLAPRAAAFDARIDGVVAYDVFYDMSATGSHFAALLANPQTRNVPGVVWLVDNAMWTLGVDTVEAGQAAFSAFRLQDAAPKIAGDVLILAGQADHFVPAGQAEDFAAACTGARSVETRIFDRQSGGAEHCQLGAHTLWHEVFFDWMLAHFTAR